MIGGDLASILADGVYVGGGIIFVLLVILLLLMIFRRV